MSRRSANELAEIGLKSLGQSATHSEERIVRAVAEMLAYCRPATRRKVEPADLPVSPREVFEAIAATETVLCTPLNKGWFGRLGGMLKNVRVEVGDLEVLCAWLASGGVAGWPQGKPTFTHALQNLDKWLAFSREWNTRGRQTLHKRGSLIGTATDSKDDFSSFSVPRVE